MNKIIILTIFFYLFVYKGELYAGIWLSENFRDLKNQTKLQKVKSHFNWLDVENAKNLNKPEPWTGVRIDLEWGDIDKNGFGDIIAILDEASNRAHPYKVILTISDKSWSYKHEGFRYEYGPTPASLDATGAITNSCAFNIKQSGDCNDAFNKNNPYRGFVDRPNKIAVQHFIDKFDGWFARKYAAKRWSQLVENAWLGFWTNMPDRIKNHPALYAIVTPESSIFIPNDYLIGLVKDNNGKKIDFGYPGGNWYVNYLVNQSKHLRRQFPAHVKIFNSINWIPPNNGGALQAQVFQRIKDEHNVGWFSQDITNVYGNYEKFVYPQLRKFQDNKRVAAMITGESMRSKIDPGSTRAKTLLRIAKDSNVGELFFLNRPPKDPKENEELKGNPVLFEMKNLINNSDPSTYPFLETTDNPQPETDGDNDGVSDNQDNCPLNPNANQSDLDSDGIGDVCDPDKDGDGVRNYQDAFPLDPNESVDTDGDGIGNNADKDDDNDGYNDQLEIAAGTDPLDATSKPLDRDGIPDATDPDDDNDGVNDSQDAFPLDPNEWLDNDGDGKGNNADKDDDNDGYNDQVEIAAGTDPLDPNSKPTDRDGDGIPDTTDPDDDNYGTPDDINDVEDSDLITPSSEEKTLKTSSGGVGFTGFMMMLIILIFELYFVKKEEIAGDK